MKMYIMLSPVYEYNSLIKNKTRELVDAPKNIKILLALNNFTVYRARLVMKGYELKEDLNKNYYSPVVHMGYVKMNIVNEL